MPRYVISQKVAQPTIPDREAIRNDYTAIGNALQAKTADNMRKGIPRDQVERICDDDWDRARNAAQKYMNEHMAQVYETLVGDEADYELSKHIRKYLGISEDDYDEDLDKIMRTLMERKDKKDFKAFVVKTADAIWPQATKGQE